MAAARRRASFGVELGRLLHKKRVTFRELSRRTGLAPPTLHMYATEKRRPPDDETIAAIAAALDEQPAVFYEWRRRRAIEHVDERPQLVETLYERATRSR